MTARVEALPEWGWGGRHRHLIHYAGRKAFDSRWSAAGAFKVVVFERREWE